MLGLFYGLDKIMTNFVYGKDDPLVHSDDVSYEDIHNVLFKELVKKGTVACDSHPHLEKYCENLCTQREQLHLVSRGRLGSLLKGLEYSLTMGHLGGVDYDYKLHVDFDPDDRLDFWSVEVDKDTKELLQSQFPEKPPHDPREAERILHKITGRPHPSAD